MAEALGRFAMFGLNVEPHREVGWATIRDEIIYGELDAAPAPAGLVVAANCGLGSIRSDCLNGLVLNLQGDAITLFDASASRTGSARTLSKKPNNSPTT